MKLDNWQSRFLQSKENRVEKQREFIRKYNSPILSLTINMPGKIKLNDTSKFIYDVALSEIANLGLSILDTNFKVEDTGCEAIYAVDISAIELKKLTCRVEDEHFLGRFMDIDVIDVDKNILTRGSNRECYICKKSAKECARSAKHPISELIEYIEKKVNDYKISL